MPWIKVAVFAVALSGLVVWGSRAFLTVQGYAPQQETAAYNSEAGADTGSRIWKAFKNGGHTACFWTDGTGLQLALAYIKYRVGVTEDQAREWTALRSGLTEAGPTMAEACGSLIDRGVGFRIRSWDDLGEHAGPVREQVAALRPDFEAFYGALNDEQRDRLRALVQPYAKGR
ncbi:MAG: hypothetical protein QNJ30_18540 [Kiloniellales bacterium]|nr:hypothetical protein [Kiloniellales bacterium]